MKNYETLLNDLAIVADYIDWSRQPNSTVKYMHLQPYPIDAVQRLECAKPQLVEFLKANPFQCGVGFNIDLFYDLAETMPNFNTYTNQYLCDNHQNGEPEDKWLIGDATAFEVANIFVSVCEGIGGFMQYPFEDYLNP